MLYNFTSICHCGNSNFQIDHSGNTENAVFCSFEKWCIDNDVLWAHLFNTKNGKGVKSYTSVSGLVEFKGLLIEV
jgi:hypothetical protein